VILGACGSSSHSGSPGSVGTTSGSVGGTASEPTYTIGVFTDLTGAAASSNLTALDGIKAGIWRARQEGINLKFVTVDTQSSPTQALSAAQQLVQLDHVFAVISLSALTAYGAAAYFNQQGMPVLGSNSDGTEWLTYNNMFADTGGENTSTQISTLWGKYLKMQGVTSMASVGYSIPSSGNAAKNWMISAESQGITNGYLNAQFPLGSTNVGPVVLQMKQNHINGLITALAPNTGLAILAGLKQQGVSLNGDLLASGYGGDLAQGGPSAQSLSQGASFFLPFEPVELHTAGTQQFVDALRAVGVQGDPGFTEYNAYISIDMLVQGLKAAGANPTHASLISALNGIHNYTGAGLFGNQTLDIGGRPNSEAGVQFCEWFVKLHGSNYDLVPGAEPLCGSVLPGKTLTNTSP
jgi:ABC-type branched-subunit amino acid transport system substrate-binding protein